MRALRTRLGLSQAAMARRAGISISYLSQIETDDRPVTPAVLAAFARSFPGDWADLQDDDHDSLLGRAVEAAQDPTIAGEVLDDDMLRRAIARQPALAERLVALHAAYQRALGQLRTLDDALDTGAARGAPLPWDEVRDWFHDQGNYVETIDPAAESIAAGMGQLDGAGMQDRLERVHKVSIRFETPDSGAALRRYDPDRRVLTIERSLAGESQLFLIAHQLMRLELADVIQSVVASARLKSDGSRRLLSVGLSNYAAGAFLMPYGAFRQRARELRHDIDALRQHFGVSFEQACHRLSTLQRPGAAGFPLFFCRVDMAGNITKRHSATRLQFARFGGACPLWIVHEAVAIPGRILVQLAETPDGVRYVSMAKGLVKASGSYSRPSRRYAVALGCEIAHADAFIYADELDLSGSARVTPIGISCRICPRVGCEQRAFPPAGREIAVDPDERHVVPYSWT